MWNKALKDAKELVRVVRGIQEAHGHYLRPQYQGQGSRYSQHRQQVKKEGTEKPVVATADTGVTVSSRSSLVAERKCFKHRRVERIVY